MIRRFPWIFLAAQAVIGWRLAHQPLTPLGLACWALTLYGAGWAIYDLWEQASTPRRHQP